MAVRHPATELPDSFEISDSNLKKIKQIIKKYPKGRQRSAVIPALDILQRQAGGWLPVPAMSHCHFSPLTSLVIQAIVSLNMEYLL